MGIKAAKGSEMKKGRRGKAITEGDESDADYVGEVDDDVATVGIFDGGFDSGSFFLENGWLERACSG
jgi:hypothetical protein